MTLDNFSDFKKKRKKATVRKPTEIGILLDKLLSKESYGQVFYLKKLRENYSEILGELLIPYAQFEGLDKGILLVKTASSVWKSELFAQKKAIIVKCNSVLKLPIVKDIKFL